MNFRMTAQKWSRKVAFRESESDFTKIYWDILSHEARGKVVTNDSAWSCLSNGLTAKKARAQAQRRVGVIGHNFWACFWSCRFYIWTFFSLENTFPLLCCASSQYLPDRLCHALTIGLSPSSSSSHAVHRMRDATTSPRGDFPQYLAWHVGKKNFPATPTSFHAFVSFGNSDLWVPAEHLCSALSHHTPQSFCTYTSTPILLYDLLTSDDEKYFGKTILINDLRIFYAFLAFRMCCVQDS